MRASGTGGERERTRRVARCAAVGLYTRRCRRNAVRRGPGRCAVVQRHALARPGDPAIVIRVRRGARGAGAAPPIARTGAAAAHAPREAAMAASLTSPATLRARVRSPSSRCSRPRRVRRVGAAPPTHGKPPDAVAAPDAEQLFGAVVKVTTRAVPDARSAATLGSEREGTGVVIGDDGLILTIGYLIVEADDVNVTDSSGRTLPARSSATTTRPASAWCARRAARRARRCRSATRPAGRARAGDDRQPRRRGRRRVRVRRLQAPVHRQLGIHARPGDLHQPADAQLERRGAHRPRRQARRRRLADRARRDRRRAAAARQHVRADRRAEADPRRPGRRRPPRGPGAAVARRCRRRGAGTAGRHRACRPTVPPIERACRSATSSSASAASRCARRREFYRKVWGRRQRGRRDPAARAAGHGRARARGPLDRPRRVLPAATTY